MSAPKRYMAADWTEMESIFRRNLFNSVSGFKALNLIGTADAEGNTNLAIFNSVVHISANPPALGFVMRPITVDRHSLDNIRETGVYTINHVSEGIYEQAHQSSAKYERNQSEFDTTGLSAHFEAGFQAPFVGESPIRMGMRLKEILPVYNGTMLVVGELESCFIADENWIAEDGCLELDMAGILAGSSLYGYHRTELIERLPFARP